MNEALQIIWLVQNHLYNLGNVFERIGNEKISLELHDLRDNLILAQKLIKKYESEELDKQLKSAKETSGALLQAILEGHII